jgi:anaerobic C4-dicarboxylate transporter
MILFIVFSCFVAGVIACPFVYFAHKEWKKDQKYYEQIKEQAKRFRTIKD